MNIYYEPGKNIPIYGYFDVVVVGGGFAGVGAAVAAARNGSKTLIVEKFSSFGGICTMGLMNNINGFRNQVKPDHIQTSKGIAEELILRLKAISGLGDAAYIQEEYSTTPGNLSFGYAVDPEKTKLVLLQLLAEAKCNILVDTFFSDVIMDGSRVTGIVVENKGGRYAIYGEAFIDASGDADLSFKAGVPFHQVLDPNVHYLDATLMYRVTGHDIANRTRGDGIQIGTELTLWGPKGKLVNALDPGSLSDAEVRTRLAVYEDLEKQTEKWPWLKNSRIIETAPLFGVRQTRFIEGEYTITADDVLEGHTFDDAIAMASKPIIAYYGYRRYLTHPGYDIPYRCMVPKNVDGLLVAGRCMSSDQPAFESWRSISPVMCLGQAAGTAAAMAVQKGILPRIVSVSELRSKLISQGAEVGQGRPDA